MSRHLKEKYLINLVVNSVAEKRIREGTSINIAIFYEAKINLKVEKERRKQFLSIKLNKNTLKYLYFR